MQTLKKHSQRDKISKYFNKIKVSNLAVKLTDVVQEGLTWRGTHTLIEISYHNSSELTVKVYPEKENLDQYIQLIIEVSYNQVYILDITPKPESSISLLGGGYGKLAMNSALEVLNKGSRFSTNIRSMRVRARIYHGMDEPNSEGVKRRLHFWSLFFGKGKELAYIDNHSVDILFHDATQTRFSKCNNGDLCRIPFSVFEYPN